MWRDAKYTWFSLGLCIVGGLIVLSYAAHTATADSTPEQRDAARRADLQEIQHALGLYYAQSGSYPSDFGSFVWIDENFVGRPGCAADAGGLKPYLPDVCTKIDPLGLPKAYAYTRTSNNGYKLGAAFETASSRGPEFTYTAGKTARAGYYEPVYTQAEQEARDYKQQCKQHH